MSPDLQIFGQHDPATIAQMQTCLRVGSVAGGVLCADGHLGYAQPVGGVVAYESDISISGVGFDIACGNMAVRLDTPYAAVKDKAGRIREGCRPHYQLRHRAAQRRARRT
jgi:tRNA-splicing ligase RtcB